ncbi:HupE/UreJ family protein [Roseibium litorale]|uniref:HupE/UreJ family protein n=1 Tax=Roseibium litorale TaxID=2803841 RepID=A0ABR9CQG2_9HYPH|nr:HupE/UreJ family protein [Roseibium litorale]MBD8893075.1 HupE/UreJ family protein [Roseibium litorale]
MTHLRGLLALGTLSLSLTALSSPAFAHLDPSEHGSFAAGFTHPVFGLDHVLAMIAVGLWGALAGGKAIWALPTAFVSSMVAGFLLALGGVHLPFVEPMILASVVAIGALVALALPLPLAACAVITGIFGLFHGHAHGGEMGAAAVLTYGLGFVCATALLHGAGVLIGFGTRNGLDADTRRGEIATRILGGLTAAAGLFLIAG